MIPGLGFELLRKITTGKVNNLMILLEALSLRMKSKFWVTIFSNHKLGKTAFTLQGTN